MKSNGKMLANCRRNDDNDDKTTSNNEQNNFSGIQDKMNRIIHVIVGRPILCDTEKIGTIKSNEVS